MELICSLCGKEIDENHEFISDGVSNWCSRNIFPQINFRLNIFEQ